MDEEGEGEDNGGFLREMSQLPGLIPQDLNLITSSAKIRYQCHVSGTSSSMKPQNLDGQ